MGRLIILSFRRIISKWLSCSNAIFNQTAKVIKMFQCAFFAISVFLLHLWIYIKCACLLQIRWSTGKIFFMLISWFSVFIDFCLKKIVFFFRNICVFQFFAVTLYPLSARNQVLAASVLWFFCNVSFSLFLSWNSSRKKWKKSCEKFW